MRRTLLPLAVRLSLITNIAYTGATNEAGNYIITGVPIGGYVIAVELQGFKSVQSTVTVVKYFF